MRWLSLFGPWREPVAAALALGTALMCGVAIGHDLGVVEGTNLALMGTVSADNRAREAHAEAGSLLEIDVSTEEERFTVVNEPWVVESSRSVRESLAGLARDVCRKADVVNRDCRVELQAVLMTTERHTRRVETREVKVVLGATGPGAGADPVLTPRDGSLGRQRQALSPTRGGDQ